MTRVIFTRIYLGLSPIYSDRRHIHHVLQEFGFYDIEILLLVSSISQFLAFLTITLSIRYLNFIFLILSSIIMISIIYFVLRRRNLRFPPDYS
tara:strand:+ start:155 stop:433 length:279 start_codon:yes stop_codon:yes gene_type:complete